MLAERYNEMFLSCFAEEDESLLKISHFLLPLSSKFKPGRWVVMNWKWGFWGKPKAVVKDASMGSSKFGVSSLVGKKVTK